jgi:hypothetical protein
MTKAHEVYLDVLSEVKTKAKGDWFIYTLYQPLPPAYWKKSAEKGGNMLDLERFDGQPLCCKIFFPAQYIALTLNRSIFVVPCLARR